MNYKADLKINKYNIDNELLEQPQKYYQWAQLASEAEIERDNAKDDYDLSVALIENKIRNNPQDYFKSKKSTKGKSDITEGAIKNIIAIDPEVRKKYKKYCNARDNYKLICKAEKAFEQRRKMLESYIYYIINNLNSEVNQNKSTLTNRKLKRRYEENVGLETKKELLRKMKERS